MRSRILIVIVVLISIAMIISVVPMATSSHDPHQSQVYGGGSSKTKAIQNLPSSLSILNDLQGLPLQLFSKVSPEQSGIQNLQPLGNSPSSGFTSEQTSSFLEPMGYVQNTLDMNTNQIFQGVYSGENSVLPTGIAYDPSNGYIYAASIYVTPTELTGALNISGVMVYSASNQSLMHVIPIKPSALSLYYDGTNGYLYVATSSDTIAVINTTTNSVQADISISGNVVYYMTALPDGTVYATLSNDTIIEIHNTDIAGYISTADYGTPYGIAYDAADGYIYVSIPGYSNNPTNFSQVGLIEIINPSTLGVVATLMPGNYVLSLAYSGGNIFGTEMFSNKIVEVNGAKIIGNITSKYGSFSIFANPYNNNLYVSYIGNQNFWSGFLNRVSNLSTAPNYYFNSTPAKVLEGGLLIYNSAGHLDDNIQMETGPVWIAFNPSNGMAFLNFILPGEITEMTGAKVNHVISTMSTPSDSYYDPYYNYLYVTDMTQGQVMVYNATGENLVAKINTGGMPFRIAHDQSGNTVYVTNLLNASVDQISGTTVTKVYDVGFLNFTSNKTTGLSVKFLVPVSITMDTSSSTLYVTTANYLVGSDSTNDYYQYVAKISTTSGITSFINTTVTTPILGISYDSYNNQIYVDTLFDREPVLIITNGTYNATLTQDLTDTIIPPHLSPAQLAARLNVAIDSEYYPANHETYVLLHNKNQGLLYPFDYSIMTIEPNDTAISLIPVEVPIQTSAFTTESIDVSGINYDPYTGMLMISSFAYPYTVGIATSSSEVNVTGGIFFINETGFQGYVSTGLGTTSAQAAGSNNIYVTNGAAGTISLVRFTDSGLSNLTLNLNPQGSTLYVNGNIVQTINGKATLSLQAGNYFIEASKTGYMSYSNYVYIGFHSNVTVNVTLRPLVHFGYMQGMVNPVDAVVQANGISVPVTGGLFNVSLESGTYYVTAFASGYSSTEITVNITSGLTTYININLTKVVNTYEVVGYISPYNQSRDPSVLLNGTAAFVNSTGYFIAYVPSGTYSLSATEVGYYPVSKNMTVTGNMSLFIVLTKEPSVTSQKANDTTLAQAFNATITNVQNNFTAGFVGVTFNATANSTLVITVPYSALSADYKNLTVSQLLSSKVYINGLSYSNFSITLSSNYNVTLSVFDYKGDPVLQWYFIPYAKVVTSPLPLKVAKPSGLNPELLYGLVAVAALVVVIAAVIVVQTRKKR